MVVKVKEKIEKTRHVENIDESKKYILRGERKERYHDKILSIKKVLKFNVTFCLNLYLGIKILQKHHWTFF